jgi:uncharacterized protein YuzE
MGKQIIESPDINIDFNTIYNLKRLLPSYDKKFNTFFILPVKSVPAVSVDWDGEFWIRVNSNGEIVGIEVENFEKVFLVKHPEVSAIWKEFKPICLKNERKMRTPEVCDSFLSILLKFFSDLFKTHPQQPYLISAHSV